MAPLALGSINPFVASFIVTNNQMWLCLGFPRGLSGKESACKCRRCGFHPRVGKVPSRRKWQLLQHSCLGNPTDAGAWWAAVHGVAKSRTWTWLSGYTTTSLCLPEDLTQFLFHCIFSIFQFCVPVIFFPHNCYYFFSLFCLSGIFWWKLLLLMWNLFSYLIRALIL